MDHAGDVLCVFHQQGMVLLGRLTAFGDELCILLDVLTVACQRRQVGLHYVGVGRRTIPDHRHPGDIGCNALCISRWGRILLVIQSTIKQLPVDADVLDVEGSNHLVTRHDFVVCSN